jgi:hypothetical protein
MVGYAFKIKITAFMKIYADANFSGGIAILVGFTER